MAILRDAGGFRMGSARYFYPHRREHTVRYTVLCPLITLAFACTAFGAVPEDYVLVWEDDFEGDSLDEDNWRHRYTGERRGAYNTSDAVSVSDGRLSIKTSYNASEDRYETGMIGTQDTFQQTYGYFEARIKLQQEGGHWSAFWLQSPNIHNESDPPDPANNGAEIDVMEYRQYHDAMQHALHWNSYEDGYHKHIDEELSNWPNDFSPDDDGFHTFGLHWTEHGYTFYIDGVETWQTTEALSHRDQYMILSTEVPTPGTGEVGWAGGNLDWADEGHEDGIYVDYVRVYVPEPATLAALGIGGLGVLLRRRRS